VSSGWQRDYPGYTIAAMNALTAGWYTFRVHRGPRSPFGATTPLRMKAADQCARRFCPVTSHWKLWDDLV